MYSEDYFGQDVSGFSKIGTDTFKLDLTEGCDVEHMISELRRVCGKFAHIQIFKDADVDEHR